MQKFLVKLRRVFNALAIGFIALWEMLEGFASLHRLLSSNRLQRQSLESPGEGAGESRWHPAIVQPGYVQG